MGVNNGTGFRADGVDIAVKAPFARRLALIARFAVHPHEDDVIGPCLVIRQCRGRDQKPPARTYADIA